MCWRSKEEQMVKIAEHDIRCFKICEHGDKPLSAYLYKFYELGTVYSDFDTDISNVDTINEYKAVDKGFHSYSPKCMVEKGPDAFYICPCKDRGTYYRGTNDWFYFSEHMAKYSCTIPKGSRYIVNEFGEYVSDRIIINKCVKKLY